MINKISSPAPSSPTRSQEWTVSGYTSSTGTQAWGVVTPAKPVETTREETPTKTALTPKSKLDTLKYGNTMLDGSSNNFGFNSSIFTPPADLDQNPTWRNIQADTFIPAPINLSTVPSNGFNTGIPNSLGSSVFTQSLGKLFG
jgi:hypothetical protein